MRSNYLKAVKFVLSAEGYWSCVKNDPGRLTIWGVSSQYWPDEVAKMKCMSKEESRRHAEDFYFEQYWLPIKGDILPGDMDIVLFDCAVNQGVHTAKDISAYAKDWRDAIILRMDKYDNLTLFNRFGRGWAKRLVSLRDYIASNYEVLEWDRKKLVKATK